ncbi:DNA polymerase IV [Acaryochloris thomasi RCC1774]|uniref:DNA-directed DNA polymerase n=1 Tax=Acaryochloris thomasi RCC1774 TaxID=1764569 RepID=A0A2W1JJA2_9CYAN|nr:DNA polymerase IV [Acaryochloris thomasi]PZD70334.1 DNA polymerase IV [Acaryochloris thomasi RCC1774]
MPSRTAAQCCSELIFVRPRFDAYREASQQIRAIFKSYTELMEPVSLDEAYLDVTENKHDIPSTTAIAQKIKQAIHKETQLTASAGVSINKFLAKMASDLDKPDGLSVILPEAAADFVQKLAIEKFHGIGKMTARKMHELGMHTGADPRLRSEAFLVEQFGKVGHHCFSIARARDDRPIIANRVRKSMGAERSFAEDLTDQKQMMEALNEIARILHQRLEESESKGHTLTLKVKFDDYQQSTRARTLEYCIDSYRLIKNMGHELLVSNIEENQPVRLLGLTVSNLGGQESGPMQLSLDLRLPELSVQRRW